MYISQWVSSLGLLLASASAKPAGKSVSSRQEPELPPCGDIIAWVKNDYTYFDANSVYQCLRSVPFARDPALRFLEYYNATIQFHAPLDTLKSPPTGYQQAAVDVVNSIRAIQSKIDAAQYPNQYQFEADIQRLIARMHDPHVQLNAGILASFTFGSPFGIISASVDGKAAPGVYIDRDVIYSRLEGWEPSPIAKINGQDPAKYLLRYAEENAASYLDSHAEWNSLMESPVADVMGVWSTFQQGTIYPGGEDDANLIIELKNGTKIEDTWTAIYQEVQDTGPLTTAGDFYNYFVLGRLPAGWKTAGKWWPDRELNGPETPNLVNPFIDICKDDTSIWCLRSSSAFPHRRDTEQGDLDDTQDELITGYILEDISTGVLSLPTFSSLDDDYYDSFRLAVQEFIENAQKRKVKRIIIDTQQNTGGSSIRAYDTFKLFFPDLEPYGASRTRKHPWANVLGTAYTNAFKQDRLDEDYASNEWVINNRINADQNTKYDSWREYFDSEGGYSKPQSYNLSDVDFDLAAFGAIPWGYDPEIEDELSGQPFDADNIVILTDGLCGSACSLFVELMSHQAGVRTIAVGGRPETGPMQAVGGSRAASAYSANSIDYDIRHVNSTLHDNAAFAQLPVRTDTGMWVNFAGFTIRNQVRKDDPTPLHFKFQAADCRIYYTLNNVYNLAQLWRDAVKATWDDSSLCVKGSTGYPSYRSTNETKQPPPLLNKTKEVVFDLNIDPLRSDTRLFEIQDGGGFDNRPSITYEQCEKVDWTADTPRTKCWYMDVICPALKNTKRYIVAVPIAQTRCETSTSSQGCQGDTCAKFSLADSKKTQGGNSNAVPYYGYCQNSNPDNKSQWCGAAVAAKTVYENKLMKNSFKCSHKAYTPKEKMTKSQCRERMRIFEKQTFAVWTKAEKKVGDGLGRCEAYTCEAPSDTQMISKPDTHVFVWSSATSRAIMQGLGG